MHIDFAPSSKGTYNNAGSSRQLASYMEHEDLERMEKGIYTDGFFNLTEDNIYKSKVVKDIDANIGQLLKTDAKFFAIHVSPSESELRAMGNTKQEKAEAMERYIREIFIPEYAKNFNKGLSEANIKFYGKIHFDRNRSANELNMHCHLIVSRKDQTGKKKLSPLTNHKNTKNGIIKGGFDRVSLFLRVEQGFDKLFCYNRQQTETFDYLNAMKNSPVSKQLELQEQDIQYNERKIEINQDNYQESLLYINPVNKDVRKQTINVDNYIANKQKSNEDINTLTNQESEQITNSFISFITSQREVLSIVQEDVSQTKRKNGKDRRV